jgi:glycosyltransferase involved in cell wall biosynthesis
MGGPAVAVVGLASAQKRAGLDVRVISTHRAGDDLSSADVLREQDIQVHLVGPTSGLLSGHPALASALQDVLAAADIVHIHALWEDIQHHAAVAARQIGIPYIFRPCGMLDPWSLSQSRWKKRLYMAWRLRRDLNGAAALHYTATLERDVAGPLELKPLSLVEPNGVDLSEFEALPPAGTFRSRYPMIGDRPLVLFLSRLHPKKGIELLLPAFARGAPAGAVLVIAGPGEERYTEQLMDRAAALGVKDRVLFTGMLRGRDRVAAFADADLFVLPSYQENFGIAVVESLAAGTPVVISDQVSRRRCAGA